MKSTILFSITLLSAASLQAGFLDSIFGSKSKKEDAAVESTEAASVSAASAADTFAQNIQTYAKNSGDSMLGSLGGDLSSQVSSMTKLFGADNKYASTLTNALGAVDGGAFSTKNWTQMLSGLSGLSKGELGDKEQASLTKTMELATAFGLQSFFKDSPYYGDVKSAVSSLKNGKYVNAIGPLKTLLDEAKISPGQQAMIDSSVGYFSDLAKKEGGAMLKKGISSFLNKEK